MFGSLAILFLLTFVPTVSVSTSESQTDIPSIEAKILDLDDLPKGENIPQRVKKCNQKIQSEKLVDSFLLRRLQMIQLL